MKGLQQLNTWKERYKVWGRKNYAVTFFWLGLGLKE